MKTLAGDRKKKRHLVARDAFDTLSMKRGTINEQYLKVRKRFQACLRGPYHVFIQTVKAKQRPSVSG